ncbi:hypothetical protein ACG7TL_006643 [Trametes sanguinea]
MGGKLTRLSASAVRLNFQEQASTILRGLREEQVIERNELDEITIRLAQSLGLPPMRPEVWSKRFAESVVSFNNVNLRMAREVLSLYQGALVLSGNQYQPLNDALRSAVEVASSLEQQWYLFSHLYDHLLMTMGASEAARFQNAAPTVQNAYQFVQDALAEMRGIEDEWTSYFITVLTTDGLQSVLSSADQRMLDVNGVEGVVRSDFDYLIHCMRKRDDITVEIHNLCDLKAQEWADTGNDAVSMQELQEMMASVGRMAQEYTLQQNLLPLAVQNIRDIDYHVRKHAMTLMTAEGEDLDIAKIPKVLGKRDKILELASDIQSVGEPMMNILNVLIRRLQRMDNAAIPGANEEGDTADNEVLKDLASKEQRLVPYEVLVARVLELKRATQGKVTRNYKGLIRHVIAREIKCSRISLVTEARLKTVELSPSGLRFYARWQKTPSMPVFIPDRKQDAIAQYQSRATILAAVQQVLVNAGCEYEAVSDAAALPAIIRQRFLMIEDIQVHINTAQEALDHTATALESIEYRLRRLGVKVDENGDVV